MPEEALRRVYDILIMLIHFYLDLGKVNEVGQISEVGYCLVKPKLQKSMREKRQLLLGDV